MVINGNMQKNMEIQLRDYQKAASDKAVAFFTNPAKKHNGIIVIPTGGGKSWCIADIANRLNDNVLIFCPSREILIQNYEKMQKICPFDCTVYSASVGQKQIAKITFATIGSAINHMEEFRHFRFVLIDECHLVNPKEGMYKTFLSSLKCKIIGLSATPYRLYSNMFGSELRFITRTRPRVFSEVVYYEQIDTLLSRGYLAKLEYYQVKTIDVSKLQVNSTGADYTDKSVKQAYVAYGFMGKLMNVIERLLSVDRPNILVFTRFVDEARYVVDKLNGLAEIVTGETPKKEREEILRAFKKGKIRVIANVGVLTTGFDFPELSTIVLARPTMSLALYYQMVGRAIRPHPVKPCAWIVDVCDNYQRFGKVEDLKIKDGGNGKWYIESNKRQLTNICFQPT